MGMNTKPSRLTGFAAVCAHAVPAGIMASSNGNASAAPPLFSNVRRGIAFFVRNIALTFYTYLLLALFYLLIDVLNFRRWAFPFVVIGSNALLIYVLWDLKALNPFPMMSKALFGGFAAHCGSAGPFLLAFMAVALWWLILFYLYRQKVFLRI